MPDNIENLVLAGEYALKGFGNAQNNQISGNMRNNLLDGGAGNDTLLGQGGDDRLTGNSGNDLLNGGDGLDILIGGTGQDIFQFTVSGTPDFVVDFSGSSGDRLQLSAASFNGIGLAGNMMTASAFISGINPIVVDANDHILYNTQTGGLYYDPDGNAGLAMVQFATLAGAPVLSSTNIWVIA